MSRGSREMPVPEIDIITFVRKHYAGSNLRVLCTHGLVRCVSIQSNLNFRKIKLLVYQARVSHQNPTLRGILSVLQDLYWNMWLHIISLKCDEGSECLERMWASSSPSEFIRN